MTTELTKAAQQAKRKAHIREAARAHTNLNTFAAVVAVLEGGCVYGDNATARKIIALAQAEQRRQLRIHDKHTEAASK